MAARTLTPSEVRLRLSQLDRFARTMDESFRIPGTRIRFGMDSLVGLAPGIGDAASLVSHAYLMIHAYRLNVRKRTQARMLLNAIIDATGGTVPILGDIFDVYWKSHRKNVELLRAEIERLYGVTSTD